MMDAQNDGSMGEHTRQPPAIEGQSLAQQVPVQKSIGSTIDRHGLPTPAASPGTHDYEPDHGMVKAYLEMHDYAIGTTFRGFVAAKGSERAMFVFFDEHSVEQDLKPG